MALFSPGEALAAPVALFFFRRDALLQRVFAAIAAQRPTRLFLIADGPRDDADRDACRAARAVVERIDWPCDVRRLYADENLGIRKRFGTGLDWLFSQVDEAIILEEDCLPDPSFFGFCASLLERYRDDERVFGIAGANLQFGRRRSPYSYYYSAYCNVWGWATWRRAWQSYSVDIPDWPQLEAQGLLDAWCESAAEKRYWRWIFDRVHRGDIDTWDYQLLLAMWQQHALFVTPESNLVSNLGFGTGSSHTWSRHNRLAALPLQPIDEIAHPADLYRNMEADRHHFARVLRGHRPLWVRRLTRTLRGR